MHAGSETDSMPGLRILDEISECELPAPSQIDTQGQLAPRPRELSVPAVLTRGASGLDVIELEAEAQTLVIDHVPIALE